MAFSFKLHQFCGIFTYFYGVIFDPYLRSDDGVHRLCTNGLARNYKALLLKEAGIRGNLIEAILNVIF